MYILLITEDLQSEATSTPTDQSPDTPPSADTSSPAASPAASPVYTEEQVQQVLQQYEHLRLQCEAYAKNCETLTSDNHQLSR